VNQQTTNSTTKRDKDGKKVEGHCSLQLPDAAPPQYGYIMMHRDHLLKAKPRMKPETDANNTNGSIPRAANTMHPVIK
jgi:hypothetical protein